MVFSPSAGPSFQFKGTSIRTTPKVVSMMKAKILVQQGGWTILTRVVNVRGNEKTIDNVLVVNEFSNVFS